MGISMPPTNRITPNTIQDVEGVAQTGGQEAERDRKHNAPVQVGKRTRALVPPERKGLSSSEAFIWICPSFPNAPRPSITTKGTIIREGALAGIRPKMMYAAPASMPTDARWSERLPDITTSDSAVHNGLPKAPAPWAMIR